MKRPKVVALSGASGSGKTALVKQLASRLSCPYLLFDDHKDTNTYPDDMKQWLQSGADVSLIKTPMLVRSLEQLQLTNNSRYIFIEEPFGKQRDAISSFIDIVVLLDPPLELCLARIIKRHMEHSHSTETLFDYLNKYEDHLRDIYIAVTDQVRKSADLIISGKASVNEHCDLVSNWLYEEELKKHE
ncbi:AAA family ATPase [Thalassotalea sp. 1_MG-2023]|uniref:AAA family ATPase n=1 Tax=Thalassotalea sp. 1_MG-2023 TaxID=3062680 RepID=UPI0026E41572|nr:AAA family ATPase [Thalassotalea sp. 1_MG-2023]MDO6426973.1 AAA family ATPase [Thalassotalea sp. 1_MG-2023]